MNTNKPNLNANEGEGSKTAGRDYDQAASEFAKSGKVEAAATEAEKFVDAHPDEAAKAEAAAKQGPKVVKDHKAAPTKGPKP